MSTYLTESADILPLIGKRLNPAELKIDLLCRGIRIDESCRIESEGRPVSTEPAALASGLELILPGEMRELWVNAPVREKFAGDSPYYLLRSSEGYTLFDGRNDLVYQVNLAPKPEWYDLRTKRGIQMSQVAKLEGTCLTISLGERCRFGGEEQGLHCRFCTSRDHDGTPVVEKTVADVVETAAMAQKQSGTTFTLLRGGYQGAGGLSKVFPYLKALKQEVGILAGVQFPPEADLKLYDQARALGVDHLSFCIEFFNQDYFDRFTPGKSTALGRDCFVNALRYCAPLLGKGRVSGEIIAGVEPVEDSMRAVDFLVEEGALPLVCVFRPMQGTEMEGFPPPAFSDMLRVFRHVYEVCRLHNLPIGMIPNVNLSTLPHPEDTLYLAPNSLDGRTYRSWILTMKQVMRPYFMRRMRKHSPSNS